MTFLLRTKSNVLSFARLCLHTGAVWDRREGIVGQFLDSLSKVSGVFGEPLSAAGLQSGLSFLSVLVCWK